MISPLVPHNNDSGAFIDVCLRDSDRHRRLVPAAQRSVGRLRRRGSRCDSMDTGCEPAHDYPTCRAVSQATLWEILVEEGARRNQ